MVILLNCFSNCQFLKSEVTICVLLLPAVSGPFVCLSESKEFTRKRVLFLAEFLQGG